MSQLAKFEKLTEHLYESRDEARAERDAAQTKCAAALVALGLASEEVRELRAEVERLKHPPYRCPNA